MQILEVNLGSWHRKAGRWSNLLDGCQPKEGEDSDIEPADIEFEPFVRQFGRCGIRVVVVMQLFSTDENTPRNDVSASVRAIKIAVAKVVSDAIDDTCCKHRDPHHLNRPDHGPKPSPNRIQSTVNMMPHPCHVKRL